MRLHLGNFRFRLQSRVILPCGDVLGSVSGKKVGVILPCGYALGSALGYSGRDLALR